jgi:hypothetical protein
MELPRLVKKPGDPVQYLKVSTLEQLEAAQADGWLLRLEPAAPYEPPVVVDGAPSGIETPRLVKKPGPPVQHKRVNTPEELAAALEQGWLLSLPTPAEPVPATDAPDAYAPVFPSVEDDPDGTPPDEGDEDPSDDGESQDEAPDGSGEPPKRKPGRPKKR